MAVPGVAQGTPDFAAKENDDAFESKRMTPEVFQLLTRQRRMLTMPRREQRSNCRARTDLDVDATRNVRDEVDACLFVTTDDDPGIVFSEPSATLPSGQNCLMVSFAVSATNCAPDWPWPALVATTTHAGRASLGNSPVISPFP